MLRTGVINYVTVDAAGLRGASRLYRNKILSIKPVNVTSFRIVFMFVITKLTSCMYAQSYHNHNDIRVEDINFMAF